MLSGILCTPGFQNFLRPPKASNISRRVPRDGPIIIFNIHETRCDAIAMKSGADTSSLHIPLKSFSHRQAIQLRDNLYKYLEQQGLRMRGIESIEDTPHRNEAVLQMVLHDLWVHIVKPVLDALGYSSPTQNRSRIWWCPNGPLASLPIHAAGIYGTGKTPGSCVSDFVISSYTPTMSALDKIGKAAARTTDRQIRLLLISQPNTLGQPQIPATSREAHAVRDIMAANGIESLLLEDNAATTTRVKEEMRTHAWVHFACHAVQDPHAPLQNSGVHLHDGRLGLLEMMMSQQLPNSEHAFLSQCHTLPVSAEDHSNLSINEALFPLAAGMLAAGYRGVVAAMWSIEDVAMYAPQVAEHFYSHLLDLGGTTSGKKGLDAAGSARALDHSLKRIQEKAQGSDTERDLLAWVPYIHFGI